MTKSADRRKMGKLERRNTLIAYSFLAPNFIGFVVFTLIPVIFSIVLAFMNWSGGSKITWVGLDNFRLIFKDFSFTKSNLGIALKNTIYYTIATVPITIACALGLALVLNKAVKGAKFFRAVFFFPYVASLVAICVCWNFLLMKTGPINQILSLFWHQDYQELDIQPRFGNLGNHYRQRLAQRGLLHMVMYLAGLQGVPAELYEAATMDGANGWQKFTKVTVPMLTPTTFFVSIMLVISCFKIYDVVAIMTQGGPGRSTKMLVTYIFELSFGGEGIATSAQYGVASAVSMVLLAIVLLVTFVQFRGEKKWVNYM